MPTSRTALSDDQSVSTAVVDAVADAEGVAPTELTPPLYRAIDPNALDELFGSTVASAENGLRISFTYSGYEVTVAGAENVVVRPADDAERNF